VGVPTYRISQVQQANGEIVSAYGYLNAIPPGLSTTFRAINGLRPDPLMLICVNVNPADMARTKTFYAKEVGLTEVPPSMYPLARPNSDGNGPFEPAMPPNSFYFNGGGGREGGGWAGGERGEGAK